MAIISLEGIMTKASGEDGQKLKDILDRLVVNCGEEYLKLHTNKQDFALSNGRMDHYEAEAIKRINTLFPATKIVKVPVTEPRSSDYDRGYNSGYTAGKRANAQAIHQAVEKALDSIGEPMMNDISIKPDSYDDVVKSIRWYKSAIQAVRTSTQPQKDKP
jgi:hypothetical protein